MNKKKNLIIMIGIIILLVVIAVVFLLVFMLNTKTDDEEKSLEEMVMDFGKYYYENYCYDTNSEILSDYTDSGFHVSIYNINVITPVSKELDTELKKQNCNSNETIISYYPKDPFGREDYDIKIELVCEN